MRLFFPIRQAARTLRGRSLPLLLAVSAAALSAGVVATPAAAQSLLAGRGLGLVVEPLDARASALGGVTLGLADSPLTWANPAAATALPAPSLLFVSQTDAFSANFGGRSEEGSTARFPLVLAGASIGGRLGLTAGYGSFVDQHWAAEQPDTLFFEGDTLALVDRFESDGGVARLRLGAGYAVTENLAVGVGVDLYTGSVQRTAGRLFPGEAVPACCRAEWGYSGVGALASVQWSRSEAWQLAAAVEVGGTLQAEPEDSIAVRRDFDLPLSATLGGSARVTGNTLVSASGRWTEWSTTDPFVAGVGGANDSWRLTGGVEWDGLAVAGRAVPLRLGARFAELPFRWQEEWLQERALTAGTGVVLAGGAVRGDLALERGWRGGQESSFDESYWRSVFSLQILGR